MNRTTWTLLGALLAAWPLNWARAQQSVEAEPLHIRVATFDSGFGGFLTAKSIEHASAALLRDYNAVITVRHYGDTKNVPYGEKRPDQIATLGSAGVIHALSDGADLVFIACNTASTQYDAIQQAVERAYPGRSADVISIIEASARRAKDLMDGKLRRTREARLAVLATPATVKSMVYPRQLAALYQAELREQPAVFHTQERWYKAKGSTVQSATQYSSLRLRDGKVLHIHQFAPANWVDLIEQGADLAAKNRAVNRDLGLMFSEFPSGQPLDAVGYFCTHFPIFDRSIRLESRVHAHADDHTEYIAQGSLMADVFVQKALERLKERRRLHPLSPHELGPLIEQSRATITISGDNLEVTRRLALVLFPGEPVPRVVREDFSGSVPRTERSLAR